MRGQSAGDNGALKDLAGRFIKLSSCCILQRTLVLQDNKKSSIIGACGLSVSLMIACPLIYVSDPKDLCLCSPNLNGAPQVDVVVLLLTVLSLHQELSNSLVRHGGNDLSPAFFFFLSFSRRLVSGLISELNIRDCIINSLSKAQLSVIAQCT